MPIVEIVEEIEVSHIDEEAVFRDIEKKHADSLSSRSELHDSWHTSHSFYDGQHYTSFNHGVPRILKAPSYRVRITHNLILPLVNTVVAKMTQQKPGWLVRPMSPENDRVQRAKATEKLLWYLYQRCNVARTVHNAVWWAAVSGTGFIHRSWDDRESLPKLWTPDPFSVHVSEGASNLTDAHWTLIVHYLTEEDIEGLWEGNAKDIVANAAKSGEDSEAIYRRDITGEESKGDLYKVYEYEEKPSFEHPEGRRIVCCGGIVLEHDSLPGGRYSLTQVRINELPGRFWGTGIVRDVIPLQREINRTLSHAIELRNMAASPVWVHPAGSVPKNAIVNRPDAKIPYNPNLGPPPMRIDPIQIPSSMYELIETQKHAMMDVSGVHEVSQGRGPAGVVSGRAIGLLSDQDSIKFLPWIRSLEDCLTELGRGLVEDYKRFADEERTITILGTSRVPEVVRFHRDMVDGEIDIIPASMLPKSPSQERADAIQMLQIGALGPIQDPMTLIRFREIAGTHGMEKFWDDDTDDRLYARRENDMISEPVMHPHIRVGWYENHIVHIDEHLKRMKEPQFQEQPPEVQKFQEQHVAEHYRQLQMQGSGLPTWVQAFGQDPQGAVQPQAGMPQAQQGPPPQGGGGGGMPPEQGLFGGGTPELNGAIGPQGPGVPENELIEGVM